MSAGRKYENISLVRIMAAGPKIWRGQLCKATRAKDIEFLVSLQYGIQADMTDLVKKKQDTPELIDCFNRVSGSINRAIREVAKRDNKPMPDLRAFKKLAEKHGIKLDPITVAAAKNQYKSWYRDKKEKDAEVERFIKKSSF